MVFIPSDALLLIWQCACFGIIRINHGINTIVGSALEQRGVPHPDALGILAVVDAFGARKGRRCDKPTVEGGAQRGRCVHRGYYEGGRWRSRYRRHCTKRAAGKQGPVVLRQGAPTRAPAWPWVRVLPDKFARESARHGREVTYHGLTYHGFLTMAATMVPPCDLQVQGGKECSHTRSTVPPRHSDSHAQYSVFVHAQGQNCSGARLFYFFGINTISYLF